MKETRAHSDHNKSSIFRLAKFYLEKLNLFITFEFAKMVVISYGTIRDYAVINPNAKDSLNNWYRIMDKTDFANFNEIRQVFNSVDAVPNDLYIFNIKGNNYRLIARIIFRVRTVYIRFIGTHNEYNNLNLEDL